MRDLITPIEDRIQKISTDTATGNARWILLAFPGQGSQYRGMGRYPATQYSAFQQIITDAANKAALTSYPILPFLVEDSESPPGDLTIDNSEVTPVYIFNMLWRGWRALESRLTL